MSGKTRSDGSFRIGTDGQNAIKRESEVHQRLRSRSWTEGSSKISLPICDQWPKIHLYLILSPLPSSALPENKGEAAQGETTWWDAMLRSAVLQRTEDLEEDKSSNHQGSHMRMTSCERAVLHFAKRWQKQEIASHLPLWKVTSSKSLVVPHFFSPPEVRQDDAAGVLCGSIPGFTLKLVRQQ